MAVVCRFCLKTINSGDFEIIDDIIKEVLDVLLLKLNMAVSQEPLVCHSCITELGKLFEFKSTCLNTEDSIYPLANSGSNTTLDLEAIYTKESKISNLKAISENQKVCRFCMQLVDEGHDWNLRDLEEDAFFGSILQKYLPEVNLVIIKDAILCNACIDILQKYFIFASNCASVEDRIRRYCHIEGTNTQGYIDLCNVAHSLQSSHHVNGNETKVKAEETDFAKDKCEDYIFMEVEAVVAIKNEEIEIKSDEKSTEEVFGLPPRSKKKQKKPKPKPTKVKANSLKSSNKLIVEIPSRKKMLHKCIFCPYSTDYRYRILRHMRVHDKSEGSTEEQIVTQISNASSEDLSGVPLYKCDHCSYESKVKYVLRLHNKVVHDKKTADVKMYKCENCDYTTPCRSSLMKHIVVHMPESEVTMYRCRHCTFQSKYSGSVQKHIRRKHTKM